MAKQIKKGNPRKKELWAKGPIKLVEYGREGLGTNCFQCTREARYHLKDRYGNIFLCGHDGPFFMRMNDVKK